MPKQLNFTCFVLLLLLPQRAWQQSGTDSLEQSLRNPMPDSVRLKTLLDIVWYNLRTDLEKATLYADSAAALCSRMENRECPYRVAYSQGMIHRVKGEYQKALEEFSKFKNYYETKANKRLTAFALYQMAAVKKEQGELAGSLDFYQQALKLNREIGNQYEAANVLNGMGGVYRIMKQHDKAIEKQQEALAIFEELKDTTGMGECLNNIGNNYAEMGQPDKALSFFQRDFELSQQAGDEYAMAYGLENMGRAYQLKKSFERSEQLYLQSLGIRRRLGYLPEIGFSLNGLGQLYNDNGRFNRAANLFRESLQIARKENMRPQARDALAGLSRAYQGLGRFEEALLAEREFVALKDSILNEETAKQLAEMDARYEASEKEKALAISNLSLTKRTAERNWLLGGAALLGLLSLAIFFGLRYRIRANRKIAAQESELQGQRIFQLEQEGKLNALSAMLEGQEQERSRIAADLHDSLGGLLASIKSHFGTLLQSQSRQALTEKTNRLIDDAATEVRRISHNMMPRALTLSGLKGALEDLAQDLRQQGLECDLETFGLEQNDLNQTPSVMIYRIVQELTHNALKHAGASHLLLQLIQKDGNLTIIAEDDGKGFDVQAAMKKKGLGLSSIQSRIQYLQGTIEWDSVPGEGTTVSISLPVHV